MIDPGLTHLDSVFAICEHSDVRQRMSIQWTVKAIRDVRRLTPRDRDRILAKIEQYAEEPASLARQVITLIGSTYMRLRVGDHRVIFSVEGDEVSEMVILRVRHRREAYD